MSLITPTKKDNVQQQILSSYYLNRYDTIMSQIANSIQLAPSLVIQKNSFDQEQFIDQTPPSRKNFKQLILQRKYQSDRKQINVNQNYQNTHNQISKKKKYINDKANKRFKIQSNTLSPRKTANNYNFKTELTKKQQKLFVYQKNKNNFLELQQSLIQKLYEPMPSKLQQTSYLNIQLKPTLSPTINFVGSDECNVYISQKNQIQGLWEEPLIYSKQASSVYLAIKNAFQIKKQKSPLKKSSFKTQAPQNFEHRSNQKITFKSKEKQSLQRLRINKIVQKDQFQLPITPLVHFDRDQFISFPLSEGQNQFIMKKEEKKYIKNQNDKIYNGESNLFLETERQQFQSKQKKKKYHQSQKIEYIVKKESNKINGIKKQEQKIQDELIIEQKKKDENEKRLTQTEESQIKIELNAKQIGNLENEKDESQNISTLSRLTMNSGEGEAMRERLEKEINENELGPYQSALSSLLSLMDDYPRARPIYVVVQRILDDRTTYEVRKKAQMQSLALYRQKIALLSPANSPPPLKGDALILKNNRLQIHRLIRILANYL